MIRAPMKNIFRILYGTLLLMSPAAFAQSEQLRAIGLLSETSRD